MLYLRASTIDYAPTLQSGTPLPNHSHREDPSAAPKPRRAASHPGWSPMDLDASHAENRHLGALGNPHLGRQEGDRTHRHGPVANPRPGRGPPGTGPGLASNGIPGQLRPAPAPDAGHVPRP